MIRIMDGGKSYTDGEREVHLFQNLNLHIRKGEFVSIMGRSGSGKSTILHILGCMDRLKRGSYLFNGSDLNQLKERQLDRFRGEHFGFVFQSFFLIKEFNVIQNIEAPMGYLGVSAYERRERALQLLRDVNLEDKSKLFPHQLSGGQQQRVALARALANRPDVIFADEPTGNLDKENADAIINKLLYLHHQGTTLVLVTHDEQLGNLAETKYVLGDGVLSCM